MPPRTPGKHALTFIAITVLLDVIGFSLIIPVMPALLIDLTGLTVDRVALYAGWLGFVYALMQFVFAPILGGLSDRFGRRPVLLYAVGALGVDYIIMGIAPTLGWLFLGRIVAGMAGASFTPAYAFVADVSPPEKRAQNFGLIGAAFGLGFVLGPALGGLLGELGPRTPFFVAAGLSLANVVYGFIVLPETLPEDKRRPFEWKRANPLGTLAQLRKRPEVFGFLVALFVWQVGHQVMPATWSFYTSFKFGWSEGMIGASLAVAGIVMVIAQGALPRVLVPRLGERKTALAGISVAIVGYIGYATATQGWMMYAWQVTWLLGALVMPTTQALMSQRVPADAQGELQGAVAGLYSLSSIVGPPLMTQLFGRFSAADAPIRFPGAAFGAAAVLAAICLVMYARASRPVPAAG